MLQSSTRALAGLALATAAAALNNGLGRTPQMGYVRNSTRHG